MLRFLQRIAPAALGRPSDPRPFSGLFLAASSPSPPPPATSPSPPPPATSPARPGLRNLDHLLTPEVLLLDATHALMAAALWDQPHSGQANRLFNDLELVRAKAARNAMELARAEP